MPVKYPKIGVKKWVNDESGCSYIMAVVCFEIDVALFQSYVLSLGSLNSFCLSSEHVVNEPQTTVNQ